MIKALVIVALLGAGGWFAWSRLARPEGRACAKLAELCGDKTDSVAKCERDMGDMRKSFGDETVRKFDSCVHDANACAEGLGCMVGAGASGVGDAMKKFLKGVDNSLNK